MTLQEMSAEYRETAALLSALLRPLRAELRACGDPDERLRLRQRWQRLNVRLKRLPLRRKQPCATKVSTLKTQ